ncbi:hypothetical protein GCM10020254_37400 [Streptomyces goshikiensis]
MDSAAAAFPPQPSPPRPLRGEWDGCCGWLSDIALLRWLGRFLGGVVARGPRPKITQRGQSLGGPGCPLRGGAQ